ncbi:MAG TPA: GFA family protein [Dokdonella sp.]
MTLYAGGCHCGRIAFEADTELREVIDCNCSMCGKRGGLLAFVPAERARLKMPESDLATYTFNTHHVRHHFCPVCGIAPFSRGSDRAGKETWSINVRCLDGVDPSTLTVKHHDGRSA